MERQRLAQQVGLRRPPAVERGPAHARPAGDVDGPESAPPSPSRSRHAARPRRRTSSLRPPPGPAGGRTHPSSRARAKRDIVSTLGRWRRSRTGTTRSPPATTWSRGRRCPATSTPTWRSSAPGSPGCGPPTPCCGPTRHPGGRARARRSPGSAPRAATAAGASATTAAPSAPSSSAGGPGAVEAMAREMHRSVDEVGAVVAGDGIDCGFHKGGAIYFATNERPAAPAPPPPRPATSATGSATRGRSSTPEAAAAIVHADGVRGALFTPHAATVHPARLARGLAVEVERLGGVGPRADARSARSTTRRARTDHGTVRADVVVRATEAYTGEHRGPRARDAAARATTWSRPSRSTTPPGPTIGLADRELFE